MDRFRVIGGYRCELYGPESYSMCKAFIEGYTKAGDFGGWDWIDLVREDGGVVEKIINPDTGEDY